MPVAESRLTQRREETVVELAHLLIDRLVRAAAEVGRDPLAPPRELPLVEEAQAGRQERDDRGGFVDAGRERGRGARLVVILQESCKFVLVIQPGKKVFAHGARVPRS